MKIKSIKKLAGQTVAGFVFFLTPWPAGIPFLAAQTDLVPRMTPEEQAISQEQMADLVTNLGAPAMAPATIEALKQAGLWTEADTDAGAVAPAAPYSAAQLAAIAAIRALGTVPQFTEAVPAEGEANPDDAFYDESIENRRNAEGVPNTALVLRRFAHHLLEIYDTDQDGLLQEAEWKAMPGSPQGIDMNGDFVLEEHEILYYLARYAKGRTVAHPIPRPKRSAARAIFKTDAPVMIRPLSAPLRATTPEDEEETQRIAREKPSDLSEEEFRAMIDQTDKEAGTEESSELFGLLMKELNESPQREFAASESQTAGVPPWFLLRDVNGDGQLSLREFAPNLSLDATAFFGRLDADSDGLVTPDELKDFLAHGLKPKDRSGDTASGDAASSGAAE